MDLGTGLLACTQGASNSVCDQNPAAQVGAALALLTNGAFSVALKTTVRPDSSVVARVLEQFPALLPQGLHN